MLGDASERRRARLDRRRGHRSVAEELDQCDASQRRRVRILLADRPPQHGQLDSSSDVGDGRPVRLAAGESRRRGHERDARGRRRSQPRSGRKLALDGQARS